MRGMAVVTAIICTLLTLVGIAGCSHRKAAAKRVTQKSDQQVLAARDRVPSVDGEIFDVKTSPDFSRIAVEWGRTYDDSKALLLDPLRREITIQVNKASLLRAQWSADSRWLAAPGRSNSILLLGKQGEKRVVHTTHDIWSLAWSPSDKDQIYYTTDNDGSGIWEINIATGSERRIDFGHSIINLFTRRGAICVAYFEQKGARPYVFNTSYHSPNLRLNRVLASELKGRKRILNVQLDRENLGCVERENCWNDYYFETSPDGEYFFIHGSSCSEGGINVIARVQDAGNIFAKPWKALMFQDGYESEDCYSVTWLGYNAFVASTSDAFLLNLGTGGRTPIHSDSRIIDLWNQGQYLAMSQDGLMIYEYDRVGELILRHKPLKQ